MTADSAGTDTAAEVVTTTFTLYATKPFANGFRYGRPGTEKLPGNVAAAALINAYVEDRFLDRVEGGVPSKIVFTMTVPADADIVPR